MKTKTLKINEKLHNELKNYCNNKMLKMNIFVENIIFDYLKMNNKNDKK